MELLLHVIQVFKYNITMDHLSIINIGFVQMTLIVVLMGQRKNLWLIGLQFQLFDPSKKVLTLLKRR